ncbi:MAG: SDR family NAD(P)-dependent oxidoreductase [Thermoguttaceae bacterium]|jgi:short-subunit dehydrogenase
MTKRCIQGLRTIVTGASSGIGREIARELARQGARLVLLARREDRLRELAAELASAVECVAGDITEPAVRQAAIDRAATCYGGLDALVNNAGIGAMGLFEDADPQRVRRVMEVNFFALVEMTRLALPLLKQGNRPILVNISSILGHRGVPYRSEYAASKFAVQGFSEALRTEWVRHGIDVLVVSPGRTETEFFARAENTSAPAWSELASVSPAEVARQTVLAMRRGRREIIPHPWGRAFVWLNRVCPRLVDAILRRYA